MPKSPWNVALAINPDKPLTGLTVVKKDWPKSGFPFTPNEVPIYISVRGAVLPEWKLDRTGLVSTLQQSPTRSFQPIQTWKLIPMGAARLRITAFPWLAPHGKAWTPAPKPSPYAPKASHVFGGDTIDALCDNVLPSSSDDETVPRLTFWDHKGTQEWVEYSFAQPKSITSTEVYWFDDSGHGGCRVPKSWKVFGKVGDQWLPIPTSSDPGVLKDRFNSVTVGPVKVTGLRLMIQLQDRYSAGILEWRVK
jgi:hypothetical protein